LGRNVIGAGSHIELLKNNVHHIEQTFNGRDAPGRGGNGFGIAVYGTNSKAPTTDLIIDGNEVHHLKTGSIESLVVNGKVTNFRITHNIVHDNNNIGIDMIGFERTATDSASCGIHLGPGIAGRQIPGQPLPDHGKQEYDLNFHGGNFATPHPQYYKNTVLKDTRAPDHGDLDILAEVLPAAIIRNAV
jgi:hypothetical protein